jgi:hypothetical protein
MNTPIGRGAPDIFMRRANMWQKTLRVVRVTGAQREIEEPQWLSEAEPVHGQLRARLPADYPAKMRSVLHGGSERCLAAAGRVVGLAALREFDTPRMRAHRCYFRLEFFLTAFSFRKEFQ